MTAPYYLNDTVPLSFQVTNVFGDAAVSSGTVDVYDPSATKRVVADAVTVQNINEVVYIVLTAITNTAGSYDAWFTLTFSDSTIRTHKMTFSVTDRPA